MSILPQDYENEFEEVVKQTIIETALEWVKDGWVKIKYTPQLSKVDVTVLVKQYTIDDIADHIGKDIGFFTDENDNQLAISSASVKWIQFIE